MIDLLQLQQSAGYDRFGSNDGSTPDHQDPSEKDTCNHLAHIANPPLLPTTQQADPRKITSHNTLSEWEADHQKQTTCVPHKIFFGMIAN